MLLRLTSVSTTIAHMKLIPRWLSCSLLAIVVTSASCDRTRSPKVAKELEQAKHEAARIASMTREERHANWPDDVHDIDGPSIETYLPRLSSVKHVTASLSSSDGGRVEINIPRSQWRGMIELFADSRPIELESEILDLGHVNVTTTNGSTYLVQILSNFANPIIYKVRSREDDHSEQINSPHFATLRSEPQVLAFFESLQGASKRRRLAGWYPPLDKPVQSATKRNK